MRGNCAHINIRCAQGFSKLSFQYRDWELAKECCAKALALAPNNAMANHVAGNIYERYDKDLERAKKHYQIAGEQGAYGAYMDLFRLKYSEVSHSYISIVTVFHHTKSVYYEVPFLFAIAQTIHYGNITSSEMTTDQNTSGAFVLILSLGFKFMQNTEMSGNLYIPFRVSYNT